MPCRRHCANVGWRDAYPVRVKGRAINCTLVRGTALSVTYLPGFGVIDSEPGSSCMALRVRRNEGFIRTLIS